MTDPVIFKTSEALDDAIRAIFRDAKAALGMPDWKAWTVEDMRAIQAKVNEIALVRIGGEVTLEWK